MESEQIGQQAEQAKEQKCNQPTKLLESKAKEKEHKFSAVNKLLEVGKDQKHKIMHVNASGKIDRNDALFLSANYEADRTIQ